MIRRTGVAAPTARFPCIARSNDAPYSKYFAPNHGRCGGGDHG